MGSFLHTHYHVSAIVNYAQKIGLAPFKEKEEIAKKLYEMNVRGFNSSYEDHELMEYTIDEFEFDPDADCGNDYIFLKAIASLIYQSSNQEGYFESEPHKMLQRWQGFVALNRIIMPGSEFIGHQWITSTYILLNCAPLNKSDLVLLEKIQYNLALQLVKGTKDYLLSDGWELCDRTKKSVGSFVRRVETPIPENQLGARGMSLNTKYKIVGIAPNGLLILDNYLLLVSPEFVEVVN